MRPRINRAQAPSPSGACLKAKAPGRDGVQKNRITKIKKTYEHSCIYH